MRTEINLLSKKLTFVLHENSDNNKATRKRTPSTSGEHQAVAFFEKQTNRQTNKQKKTRYVILRSKPNHELVSFMQNVYIQIGLESGKVDLYGKRNCRA